MKISYNPLDICTRSYRTFTVLYDLRNRQLLQLEDVSADIWGHIVHEESTTLDKIINFISGLYECNADEIADDIIDFLQDLYAAGILQFDAKYCQNTDNDPQTTHPITENDDFEGQIIGALETENQLYSATIEMTYACNEKCIHCYAHYPTSDNSSNHLTLAQYQEFIDELYSNGALHIAFTGGDPFMNPNFLELFKYSRLKGFVTDIFTNGLYLSNHPSELNEILALRPRAFYMSLYGSSAEIHDSITGIPGSFEKTISVVKTIHSADIPVVFNVMLLAENYNDLDCIISLATNLGVEYRVSMSLIYRNDGSNSPMGHFIGDKRKIKKVLRTLRSKVYSIDRPVENKLEPSEFMCGAGVTSLCLSPDGTVFPCVSLKTPLGNINASNVSEIWSGDARKSIVSSLRWDNTKECKSCPKQNSCPHCAGMSQAESGDMFACNTCDKLIAECISEL